MLLLLSGFKHKMEVLKVHISYMYLSYTQAHTYTCTTCVCVCLYVCKCTQMYVPIHIHTPTYTHIHPQHPHTPTYTHTHPPTHTHTHTCLTAMLDYIPVSQNIFFNEGVNFIDIPVNITNDFLDESDEVFFGTLTPDRDFDVEILRPITTITIFDDNDGESRTYVGLIQIIMLYTYNVQCHVLLSSILYKYCYPSSNVLKRFGS